MSVSGDTVSDVLNRFEAEVSARVEGSNETMQLIYSIGVNDTQFLIDKNQPRFSPDEFRNNLSKLIDTSLSITNNISFLGLLPVDESKVNPIPWAMEKSYLNKYIKLFEEIIGDVCQHYNLQFYPLFDLWSKTGDYQKFLIDGIHPNTEGHAYLFSHLQPLLLNKNFFELHS